MAAMVDYLLMLSNTSDTLVDYKLIPLIPTKLKLTPVSIEKTSQLPIADMEAITLPKETRKN
jgi:hypothetical protein